MNADTMNPFARKRTHYADIGGFLDALEKEERGVADFLVHDRAMEILANLETVTGPDGVDERIVPTLGFEHAQKGRMAFPMLPHARNQLAEKFGVSRKYAERMHGEAGDLYATNFNFWFQRSPATATKLVRTLHGQVRAVLSQNYRIVDNLDLAHEILTTTKRLAPKAELFTWSLNEANMSLAVFDPTRAIRLPSMGNLKPEVRKFLEGPLAGTIQDPEFERRGVVERMIVAEGRDPKAGGDLVFPGLVAGNSQVGTRTAWVKVGMFVASCSNRFLVGEDIAHRHLGRDLSTNADLITSRETRRLENGVVFSRIRDAVEAVFNPEEFARHVGNLCATMTVAIPKAVDAVDALVAREKWSRKDNAVKNAILNAWRPQVAQEKATVFDLLQAATQAAQEFEEGDPDFALEMEERAGSYVGEPVKKLASMFGGVVLD